MAANGSSVFGLFIFLPIRFAINAQFLPSSSSLYLNKRTSSRVTKSKLIMGQIFVVAKDDISLFDSSHYPVSVSVESGADVYLSEMRSELVRLERERDHPPSAQCQVIDRSHNTQRTQ